MKDCIIIGGGPAGLTAALYLARFLRSVTVFDSEEGRARMIPKTHNLAPFPDGISGRDLLDRMRTHAERYGAVIEKGTVGAVEKQGDGFLVKTDRRFETARSVIFASGVVNQRPPLSVSEHDRGLARGLIRYCPVCDAYEIRDKRVAVLGSGAHGFAEASFIREYSPTVTLIPPDGSLPIARDGINVLGAPMKGLALSDTEVVVTLENGETRQFDTLYVALGTTACTDLADRLGVRLGEDGCVVSDAEQRTSIERVYAIGDVTDGLDQIAQAMGQAAVAATAIHNELPRTKPG
ncbi:MAG: thioredoxin reductase [Rhodobacterales bacterium 12-64-8]|nr:MAG: thioredoxin reductase [Rhodobacterales bacterium 12-64-8]